MTHVSDDDFVLLHYSEEAGPEAKVHLGACTECAERLRQLGETLALARAPEVPERDQAYGARVWARLQPRLAERGARARVRPAWRWSWPRAAGVTALAASLVVAFLLGRQFPGRPQPLSPEVRERVLLLAVGDHLERSQMVLVELVNAPGDEPLDVSAQRAFAGDLVSASRLYRQTAVRSGERAVAAVLEELERVLVEVAAGPDPLSPADLRELQRRIESRGLLFKVRVIESHVREREKQSLPRAAGVS